MRSPRALSNAACLAYLTTSVVGCSTTKSPAGTSPADGQPDAHVASEVPDAAPAQVCHGPGYATPVANTSFSHLSATVVDGAGAPVPSVSAQACGTNLCLNGTTDAHGHVLIDGPSSLTKPAFKYGGGIDYVKFAFPLAGHPDVNVNLGPASTFRFDAAELGVALTPGTSATSNGVTLVLPADMNPVAPDPFDFDTADLQNFRAVTVPLDHAPPAVDASYGFGIVVGLAPNGTELCPAAKLRVPNSPNWPMGAKAEFWLHGIDVAEEWAPYGGWAKVSDGAVTADGTAVETDDAGGLPSLSVVGVRLVP